MPTTKHRNFDALHKALISNNTEDLKKVLENFHVNAVDEKGKTCLMHVCNSSASSEVMKLVFEKIEELGGRLLLKSHLSASDKYYWNCLGPAVTAPSSADVKKLLFEKIADAGDTALLKSQMTRLYGGCDNCLMLAARYRSPTAVMKLLLEKVVEVGDTDLLKKQLTENTDRNHHVPGFPCNDATCLILACYESDPRPVQLLAVVLFHLGLFEEQYAKLDYDDKKKLEEKSGINSSSWTPDAASLAEVEILLEEGIFFYAINNNQHSRMKELLKNDLNARRVLTSKFDTIIRASSARETTIETMKLLFSEIKRIGGDQYLKELFLKETDDAGETWLHAVCLRDANKLEFFLDTVEELGGEEFLAEQIAKKRESSFLCLLCKFAPKYEILALFVSKIFQTGLLGRRFLKNHLENHPSCLRCLFSFSLDSPDDKKFLVLIVSLYAITGLFEDQYSRLDEEKQEKIRRICKVESGKWSRGTSNDSTMSDVIGEIKKSIKNKTMNS